MPKKEADAAPDVEEKNRYLTPVGQPRVPEEKLVEFLRRLAEYGNVTRACREAGIAHMTAYRYRDRDPAFAEAWERAARIGALNLEDEARRRAYEGWQEPVVYQGRLQEREIIDNETGKVIGMEPVTIRKFSDTLLIFLLKGHFPEKYKDRTSSEVSGPGGAPIQHEVAHQLDLSKLSTDEIRTLLKLAEKTKA